MKYIRQFTIILVISFAGELLHALIPWPIPASIYGLAIMLFCLITKKLKVSDIKETSSFLIEIMPVMFIPAAVGLMTSWNQIRQMILPYTLITLISLIIVFAAAGRVTQAVARKKG